MRQAFRIWLALVVLAALVTALMQAAVHFDPLMIRLAQQAVPSWLSAFMARSIFEGGAFGGGDFATLTVVGLLVVYLVGQRGDFVRRSGSTACACIVLGCAVVHPLKHLTSRARPLHSATLHSDILLSTTKPLARDDGALRADRSFPSGHTATAMSFGALALGFAVTRSRSGSLKVQSLPFIAGTFVTNVFAVVMGAARVAQGDHWPTDVLASVVLGWAVFLTWFFMTSQKSEGTRDFSDLRTALLISLFSWLIVLFFKAGGGSFVVGIAAIVGIGVAISRSGILRNVPSSVYWMIGICTFVRYLIANQFPLTNDEAYYWDWSRSLQWSYLDHPPGVAWMTWLSNLWFGSLVANGYAAAALAVRGVFPLLHIGATFALIVVFDCCVRWLFRAEAGTGRFARLRRQGMILVTVLAQLIPIFSLVGVFALPDGGLYLFLAIGLALAVPLIDTDRRASSGRMLAIGLALGTAFCFKYHAGFLGLMLLSAMFWIRRGLLRKEMAAWTLLIVSGLAATFPVLIWNLQNEWASVVFQTTRRLARPEFNVLAGGQVLVGQMLALTPVFFLAAIWIFIKPHARADDGRLRLLGASLLLPMVLAFTCVAFFKSSLPHWTGPAFFVCVPFFAALWCCKSRPKLMPVTLWTFLGFALPVPAVAVVFGFDRVEDYLLTKTAGNPGPLEEITLWSRLAPQINAVLAQVNEREKDALIGCPDGPELAATRWFSVAQLAFHMKGHPLVRSVDLEHRSYYHYRDRDVKNNCPRLIVSDIRSVNRARLAQRYHILTEGRLIVPRHEGIDIRWMLAAPRGPEAWSWTF